MKPPPASRVWRALVVVLFWAYALLNTYFTFSPLLRSTPRLAFILVPLVMGGSSLSHAMYMLGLRHALAFFALAALISLAFEAAGVATGAVYGPYHYTDFLDPKLFDVPLLVPLSWFMIIYPGYALVNYLGSLTAWYILFSAVVALLALQIGLLVIQGVMERSPALQSLLRRLREGLSREERRRER